MITAEKAGRLVVKNSKSLSSLKVRVTNAYGMVLANNIPAPVNLPSFKQSAMDGYAIKFSDHQHHKKLKVIGEVAAGNMFAKTLTSGQAVRIFTGASLPTGADTIVMQEKTTLENGYLHINDPDLKRGCSVRKTGAQVKKGKTAILKGTLINPGTIAYLSALGLPFVNIISPPLVSLIVTGNELKKPGEVLKKGQVYECNSFALGAALKSMHLNPASTVFVPDLEEEIHKAIIRANAVSDLILITGGISVGDYDFVSSALKKTGAETIFYKVNQKPGKPLFFGKYKNTLIFALPGNPAAVLSCFYEYVYPAINRMLGKKEIFLKKLYLPIAKSYPKKTGLALFLKGKISGNKVHVADSQESYMLSSFTTANSLIYLPAPRENVRKGELVEVHLLPVV